MVDSIGLFGGSSDLAVILHTFGANEQKAKMALEREKDAIGMEIKEIDGVKFRWDFDDHRWRVMDIPLPKDEPAPKALDFFTLCGLVEYINENTEGLIPSDGSRLILQVCDEKTVVLLSQPSRFGKERHVVARSEAHAPQIEFERYMDTETFSTMLLSKFIDTPARKTLFGVVSSMVKEQNCNTTDDGVSQVITVKQGVSMAANVTFQNPVPLKPMRTFAEVEQPESNFTLRVNEEARCALFESDGGAWKNEAVGNIRAYLKENITNPAVVVMA